MVIADSDFFDKLSLALSTPVNEKLQNCVQLPFRVKLSKKLITMETRFISGLIEKQTLPT